MEIGIRTPEAHGDKTTSADNDRCEGAWVCPWVCAAAKVDSNEEESTPRQEEKHPDPVHLLHKLPPCLPVLPMLHLKIRWVVKEEKDEKRGAVERK